MICHVLFVFSILLSYTGQGEGATSAYDSTDVLLINCGATSENIDTGGRTWTPDEELVPWNLVDLSFAANASHQDVDVPYTNARIFRSDFTYKFRVSPGWKFLRLYFYPTRYGSDFDAVNSFFSVNVNGFTLLSNFSADLTVRTSNEKSEYFMKEFIVPVSLTLKVTFTPSPNSLAFVNGVEIVSMPDRFYTKGGFNDEIRSVGTSIDFEVDETTAFPVDAGFTYLVRLHFCETLPEVNAPGQRVFTIFIGNQTAEFEMDVIQLSGGSRNPVYLDFIVVVGFESELRPDLRLDLLPYWYVKPTYLDAILNGVEILKLYDSEENLAGPNPNLVTSRGKPQVLVKATRQKRIVTRPLIAVGSAIGLVAIIVVLLLLMRQIKRKKNLIGASETLSLRV